MLVKRIFAKGKTNIHDIAKKCEDEIEKINKQIERAKERWGWSDDDERLKKIEDKKGKWGHHTSESLYEDYQMIADGLCLSASMLEEQGIIEAIVNMPHQKEVYDKWKKGDLDTPERWLPFEQNVYWRFAEGGRKKYLNHEIRYPSSITL